jgi:hypothetical protein
MEVQAEVVMERNFGPIAAAVYPLLIGGSLMFAGMALGAFQQDRATEVENQQQQIEEQRRRAAAAQSQAMYGLLVPMGMIAIPATAILGMYFILRKGER